MGTGGKIFVLVSVALVVWYLGSDRLNTSEHYALTVGAPLIVYLLFLR